MNETNEVSVTILPSRHDRNINISRAYGLFSADTSVHHDLPRRPEVAVDELHRHLAVDDLDDVHRVAFASATCFSAVDSPRHFALTLRFRRRLCRPAISDTIQETHVV